MTTPAPVRACALSPGLPAGWPLPQCLRWAPWASLCQLLLPGGALVPLSWAATIHSRLCLSTGLVAIGLYMRPSRNNLPAWLMSRPAVHSAMAVHQQACEQAASRPKACCSALTPTCSAGLQSERWVLSRWAAASPMGLNEAGPCSTS